MLSGIKWSTVVNEPPSFLTKKKQKMLHFSYHSYIRRQHRNNLRYYLRSGLTLIRGEGLPDDQVWVRLMRQAWSEYRCTHALPLFHQHTRIKHCLWTTQWVEGSVLFITRSSWTQVHPNRKVRAARRFPKAEWLPGYCSHIQLLYNNFAHFYS